MFSKFDEDTHLAIALSVTDSEKTESLSDFKIGNQHIEECHPPAKSAPSEDVFAILMASKSSAHATEANTMKNKKKAV